MEICISIILLVSAVAHLIFRKRDMAARNIPASSARIMSESEYAAEQDMIDLHREGPDNG